MRANQQAQAAAATPLPDESDDEGDADKDAGAVQPAADKQEAPAPLFASAAHAAGKGDPVHNTHVFSLSESAPAPERYRSAWLCATPGQEQQLLQLMVMQL